MKRPRIRPQRFILDANCLMNGRDASPEMKQLLTWAECDVIQVRLTEHSERPIARSADREKAWNRWIIYVSVATNEQRALYERIRCKLFNKTTLSDGEHNDVMIVFAAIEWLPCILLTYDGLSRRQPRGILGAAPDLASEGLQVMHPRQAVEMVAAKITRGNSMAAPLS